MASMLAIFDAPGLRISGSFLIGLERPPNNYNGLRQPFLTAAEVLLKYAQALNWDVHSLPSFVLNMFIRPEDFISAQKKKPSLKIFQPILAPTPGGKNFASNKNQAGFFAAIKEIVSWVIISAPSPGRPGQFGGGGKREELEYD